MRMIRPQLDAPQVTIAEDQDEFKPVTAALVAHTGYPSPHPSGFNSVVLAFRPTEEERRRLAAGDDLYVSLLTFLQPMQGIIVLVGKEDASAVFNVPPERPA